MDMVQLRCKVGRHHGYWVYCPQCGKQRSRIWRTSDRFFRLTFKVRLILLVLLLGLGALALGGLFDIFWLTAVGTVVLFGLTLAIVILVFAYIYDFITDFMNRWLE